MVELQSNRSVDLSSTINAAIAAWSSDGRTQLYVSEFRVFPIVICLLSLLLTSQQLYKKLLDVDQIGFEAELGKLEKLFKRRHSGVFLALKQLLLSLCKSCLQGTESVENIIRIFGELQVR